MTKFFKRLKYRVNYRIRNYLELYKFYREVFQNPVLVKNSPQAITNKHVHKLECIEFTVKGANLHFHPLLATKADVIGRSLLILAGDTHPMLFGDIHICNGDTFSPTWELELNKIDK